MLRGTQNVGNANGRESEVWKLPSRERTRKGFTDTVAVPFSQQCAGSRGGIPLWTMVMRKEARHTQMRDRASGVDPDILDHLPPKKTRVCLLYCFVLSPLISLGAVPRKGYPLQSSGLENSMDCIILGVSQELDTTEQLSWASGEIFKTQIRNALKVNTSNI